MARIQSIKAQISGGEPWVISIACSLFQATNAVNHNVVLASIHLGVPFLHPLLVMEVGPDRTDHGYARESILNGKHIDLKHIH